jgi:hypothetical protein
MLWNAPWICAGSARRGLCSNTIPNWNFVEAVEPNCFVQPFSFSVVAQGLVVSARMQSMERQYATVESDGELEIPVTMRQSMEIVAGSDLWIQRDASNIIMEVQTRSAKERGLSE